MSTPEFYTGYPALERVSQDRLKPAWLLRYWYLLQGLGRNVDRRDVYPLWAPLQSDRHHMCNALRLGDGVFWRRLGTERLEVFSPEELHARLGLTLTRRRRPFADLYLKIKAWHRSLVEDAVAKHVRPEGGTDPLSQTHLGRQVGLSRRTVQRCLAESRSFRAVGQWLVTPGLPSVTLDRRRTAPAYYFRHLAPFRLVAQRLPNRYVPLASPESRVPHPEPLSTAVGRLLRRETVPFQTHPHYGELWTLKKEGTQTRNGMLCCEHGSQPAG